MSRRRSGFDVHVSRHMRARELASLQMRESARLSARTLSRSSPGHGRAGHADPVDVTKAAGAQASMGVARRPRLERSRPGRVRRTRRRHHPGRPTASHEREHRRVPRAREAAHGRRFEKLRASPGRPRAATTRQTCVARFHGRTAGCPRDRQHSTRPWILHTSGRDRTGGLLRLRRTSATGRTSCAIHRALSANLDDSSTMRS